MKVLYSLILFFTFLLIIPHALGGKRQEEMPGTVFETLLEKITSLQQQKESKYFFPFSWYKQKGLFESWIHLNMAGDELMKIIRDDVKFYDNNFFVTGWVVQILVETHRLQTVNVDSKVIEMALETLLKYSDQNHPDIPMISFWPQTKKDNIWYAYPQNLIDPMKESGGFLNMIRKFLTSLHLDGLWDKLKPIFEMVTMSEDAFNIPTDSDDTSINFALGASLYDAQKEFPDMFNLWNTGSNRNLHLAVKEIVKYSYQPLSKSLDDSILDPRSYLFMHDFLHTSAVNTPDFKLSATWLLNLTQDRQFFHKKLAMPFNVNNVDITVCSNFLYGVTHLATSNIVPLSSWLSDEVKQMIYNNVQYIQWVIKSGRVGERPDIGLTYYPPLYDFYWFASRTLSLLSTEGQNFPDPIFEKIFYILQDTFENEATPQLLNRGHTKGDYLFWDDFLGVNDTNISGKPINRAEDRLFTTSIVLNALIDTWSTRTSDYKYVWKQKTPQDVKKMIKMAANWITKEGIDDYKPENAFFSGSVKGGGTLPAYYPTNYIKYLNGTAPPPNPSMKYFTPELINAMKGIVDQDTYEKMLNEMHFGSKTPRKQVPYNGKIPWPYWSSPALTYSVSLLGISKYEHLKD
ncbi:hypothetical protein M0812_08890 [Anaeramoeba flamelloides]|uniref:Uncharacterized protein n=1 Tax=Anaeramoeba flamelloides TaxID=1746091 RepID=A0AAV7ZWM8_9EUKA|nr:hypothetical protein M0812_08890 [Anaeramoeba flamelloides]|eukprot:Anaeramoba_flamelloidesa1053746_740.p1 GENE.a1053746_740~~a1053746_740.p1  ORF type:complete len:630 (-),score=117.59 a1053746_740:96-1985(-)